MTRSATDLYRIWNQRVTDGKFRLTAQFGDGGLEEIGNVTRAHYQSSKYARACLKNDCGWVGVPQQHRSKVCEECGGRTEASDEAFDLYVHDFDSRPSLYAPSRNGTVHPLDLLKLESWRCEVAVLGFADDLTYKDVNGGTKTLRFRGETFLVAPNDRTLLIVKPSGPPLVIKGGKMILTADGVDH